MSSRNSPRRRHSPRPNPRSRGTTPDPSFINEFSRMLIDKEAQFQAKQKQSAEEKARIHQAAIEEADTIHDQVREHALQTLDAYLQIRAQEREEASRQMRARHEEESRAFQLEATNKRLEDERRKAEQEKEIQEKLNEANALAEKTQAAEDARLSTPAKQIPTLQQQAPPPAQHQAHVQNVQPPPVQQAPAVTPLPSTSFQSALKPQAVQSPAPAMAPNSYQASPIAKSIFEKDAKQKQYLDLHKTLKVLRKDLKNAGPGARVWTDKRRDFKKALGQLSSDTAESLSATEKDTVRKGNSDKRSKMLGILQQAMTAPGPKVDARNYLISCKPKFANMAPEQAQVPAVFICLINYFAKISIKMLRESTLQTMTNLVGISIAFMFGHLSIRWNGESFIDIFLAKYHKACPVLFGIYGPENTQAGRDRIGWGKEGDSWIDTAVHQEEMMGLAMGWSAVTLRDFKTSKTAQNSLPAYHFWTSVANIVNVPAKDVQETHLIVLKNILEHYADKFVKFYGQAAMVAMRRAVVEFPAPLKESTARSGLILLREIFGRKFGIRL
ncbi:GLE1-domain-containing protein [Venturia nashicola]|uniref:mRNA export factor GLE1 n=1 Tax=Venturia nashicola TaxID=86259 RepID=A0A4Z1P0I3_9PEZI|nr:GLE1-domain-containing protein [Venturia nashicola]TLD34954.1 GLE1-domain-containing protein [Venturia nashicola]